MLRVSMLSTGDKERLLKVDCVHMGANAVLYHFFPFCPSRLVQWETSELLPELQWCKLHVLNWNNYALL